MVKTFLSKFKPIQNKILILLFFILLSSIITYPTIFKMNSHLYGSGGDALGAVWHLWWLKYAHLHRLSPETCHLIAYPYGVNFAYAATRHFLWESLLLPVSLKFGEVFAYNFSVLPSFFLSAIIAYYLVYYFTKNKLASLIAGIIYAFCPFHFTHSYQHLTLANIQWIPLFFLALFNLDERRTYGSAILAALAFSLVFLSNYYYGYFVTIFTGVFILWRVWYGWRNRRLSGYPVIRLSGEKKDRSLITDHRSPLKTMRVVLVATVVALAIILPAIYPILKNVFSPKPTALASLRYERSFSGLFTYSAHLFHYLIPSGDNPFIGGFTRNFIKVYHPVEQTLYLGWVGIILSIIAIREWRRKNKLVNKLISKQVNKGTQKQNTDNRLTGQLANWSTRTQKGVSFFLFAGIMALIFSHAPWTDIGPFRIFFPSYFMYKIAPMFRCYARFGILVMLSVSVLAGIGLASILQKIKTPQKREILVALIVLLICIEFAPTFPAPMINAVDPPPVYEWLSKQEGDFIVAEYPMENDVEYLFWQRIHQKRLVNGALPGTHADKVRKEIVDILDPKTPGILKHLGAKYVIFHPEKYATSNEVAIIGEIPDIKKQPGLRLIKSFPEAEVYEVMAPPIEPEVRVGEDEGRRMSERVNRGNGEGEKVSGGR